MKNKLRKTIERLKKSKMQRVIKKFAEPKGNGGERRGGIGKGLTGK